MKNFSVFLILVSMFFAACKGKKVISDNKAISAVSIIRGQIKHLDTSFYQIMKYVMKDGKTDSSYLKREDVRTESADFLSLPDITQNDLSKNYSEEHLLDNSQNALSIIYTAKQENLEIKKQIIIVPIDELAAGKVQSIFFDRYIIKGDSTLQQKLFWQVDKFFQVGTILQVGSEPEQMTTSKVTWE